MLTNPLPPMLLPLEVNAIPANTMFRPGQILHATVQGQQGNTFLLVGATRVALPAESALVPGAAVRAEVVETAQGMQLRVTMPAVSPRPEPVGVLAGILRKLDALPLAREAEALLPTSLPQREDTIGPLLRTLLTQSTLTRDMANLAALLSEAQRANALPPGLHAQFTTVLGQFSAVNAEGIHNLLKRLSQQQRVEARLAQAVQTGGLPGALEDAEPDLRTLMDRLVRSESLRAFVRQGNRQADFDAAVSRILDRLSGAQHQNLHGQGEPYLFIEMPFPDDSGVSRAQIHLLEEGKRGAGKGEARNHIIAFDLETERLGALWVTLRVSGTECVCHLRAVSTDVIRALRDASAGLLDALDGAGYGNARVRVSRWDGNRIREVVALTRRFTGLNLNG